MNQNQKFKPKAAQLKTGVSAQSIKPPVVPPVYSPQQVPKVLQPKRSSALSAQSGQAARHPVFHRPSVTKTSVVQRSDKKKGRFDFRDWEPLEKKEDESQGESNGFNFYYHQHGNEPGYHIKIDNGSRYVNINISVNGQYRSGGTLAYIQTKLGVTPAVAQQLGAVVESLRKPLSQIQSKVTNLGKV